MHEQPTPLEAQLLAEYQELRKEILQNETLILQSLVALVILASALMTTAFSEAVKDEWVKAVLFFGAEAVAVLSLWQSAGHQEGNYLIGAYIAKFIEPELPGVKWETRLRECQRGESPANRYRAFGSRRLGQTALILINLLLGIIYLHSYLSENHPVLAWLTTVAPFLLTFFMLQRWKRFYETRLNRETHAKRWDPA